MLSSFVLVIVILLVIIVNSNAFTTSICNKLVYNNKKLVDKYNNIIDNYSKISLPSTSTIPSSSSSSSSSLIINKHNTKLNAVLKPEITKLIDRKDLTTQETEAAWDKILSGCDPAAVGALLTLLRAKGYYFYRNSSKS